MSTIRLGMPLRSRREPPKQGRTCAHDEPRGFVLYPRRQLVCSLVKGPAPDYPSRHEPRGHINQRTPQPKIASAEPCSSHSLRRTAQHRAWAPHACHKPGRADHGAAAVHAVFLWSGKAAGHQAGARQRGEPERLRGWERVARTEQIEARADQGAVAATPRKTAVAATTRTAAPATHYAASRAAAGSAAIAAQPPERPSPVKRAGLWAARHRRLPRLPRLRARGNGAQWRAALCRDLVSRAER